MTTQELQIAVAEEMGWKSRSGVFSYDGAEMPWTVWSQNGGEEVNPSDVPPYSTSLDAIQKAALEKFKTDDEKLTFAANLLVTRGRYFWQLTAADWCVTFLNTCKEIKSK